MQQAAITSGPRLSVEPIGSDILIPGQRDGHEFVNRTLLEGTVGVVEPALKAFYARTSTFGASPLRARFYRLIRPLGEDELNMMLYVDGMMHPTPYHLDHLLKNERGTLPHFYLQNQTVHAALVGKPVPQQIDILFGPRGGVKRVERRAEEPDRWPEESIFLVCRMAV